MPLVRIVMKLRTDGVLNKATSNRFIRWRRRFVRFIPPEFNISSLLESQMVRSPGEGELKGDGIYLCTHYMTWTPTLIIRSCVNILPAFPLCEKERQREKRGGAGEKGSVTA